MPYRTFLARFDGIIWARLGSFGLVHHQCFGSIVSRQLKYAGTMARPDSPVVPIRLGTISNEKYRMLGHAILLCYEQCSLFVVWGIGDNMSSDSVINAPSKFSNNYERGSY